MIKKCIGLFSLVFLISCTEKTPLPVTANDNVGQIVVKEIAAEFSLVSQPEIINTGFSRYLYLGEVDHKKSAILMRFEDLPDSSEIISAKLEIITQDTLVRNDAPFEAIVYKSPQHFESLEVTSNNFPYDSWSEDVARATVTTADTDTVTFDLDPQWVETWKDSTMNMGLVIATDAPGVARRFGSTSDSKVAPVLNLIYKKINATENDTVISVPAADTFIYEQGAPPAQGPIYVGTGEEYRSMLKFKISDIPASATINQAELVLTVDHANSFLSSEGIQINAFRLENEAADPFAAVVDSSFTLSTDFYITPDVDSVDLLMPFIAQQWTRQDTLGFQNDGLLLFAREKYQIFSRIAFYNVEADSGRAPKLLLHYTTPPSYE